MAAHDRPTEAGFTLMEVAVVLVFATLMILTLQSSMLATVKTRQRTAVSEAVQTQGYEFLQRLIVIPFGKVDDTPATAAQLDELFDGDADLGNVTLRQLIVGPDAPGYSFTTRRDGTQTTWRVHVSTDLDGDGEITGFRENRPDLAAMLQHELEASSIRNGRFQIAGDRHSIRFARLVGADLAGSEVSGTWSTDIEIGLRPPGNLVRIQDGQTALLATGLSDLAISQPAGSDCFEVTVSSLGAPRGGVATTVTRTVRIFPKN